MKETEGMQLCFADPLTVDKSFYKLEGMSLNYETYHPEFFEWRKREDIQVISILLISYLQRSSVQIQVWRLFQMEAITSYLVAFLKFMKIGQITRNSRDSKQKNSPIQEEKPKIKAEQEANREWRILQNF